MLSTFKERLLALKKKHYDTLSDYRRGAVEGIFGFWVFLLTAEVAAQLWRRKRLIDTYLTSFFQGL